MFSKLIPSFKRPNLEILLEESYHNKLKQYDLMKEFLISKIYVRGMKKSKELFLNYEEDSLLAFSSENTLQNARQSLRDYVYCEVDSVLKVMPAGIRLLLNTGPNYGKEFLPNELAFLKDGKIPPDLTQTYQMEAGQKFSLFPPREIPEKLIDALFEEMRGRVNIDKAFLAEILDLNEKKPNLIVGIKVFNESDFAKDVAIVSEAVKGAVGPNEYVDFIQILDNDKSTIAKFMLTEIKPFFDRAYL